VSAPEGVVLEHEQGKKIREPIQRDYSDCLGKMKIENANRQLAVKTILGSCRQVSKQTTKCVRVEVHRRTILEKNTRLKESPGGKRGGEGEIF